jgi:CheY-like chemotaxis protein
VCISVEDTGPGIPDDAIDKIFEPFFSTKEEGEGTGLGLSTAYSIVKSHDGFIDVESSDAGTRFDVYVPVADVDAPERTAPQERELTGGSGETVLVVDDEAFILETARETLNDAGYQALTADGAEAALHIMETRGDEIDAVITDLRMPSMDGFALIRRLHAQRPNLPIIAASGMADGRTDDAVEAGARTFLAKPFTADKLQAALQDVLQPAAEA